MYSRKTSSGSWPMRSARRLATPLTSAGAGQRLDARRSSAASISPASDDLVAPAPSGVGLELAAGQDRLPRRRSPTKRGSRRFAAPGMIPSLRAGR